MRTPHGFQMLRSTLAGAGDAEVARVVTMVDAMARRGVADALIEPLRPRLAQMRPIRPFSFARLLFVPVDPLIVPAPAWRRGTLSVPRTALGPIAAALRELLPDEASQIDAQAGPGDTPDARIGELAAMLWPRAAAALGGMPVPPGWGATGLADSDYPPMAAAIAALLGVALGIQAIALMGEAAPEGAIRTILGRTAPRGGPALSAVVAVLLARLPGSGRIVSLATEAAGGSPPRSVDAAVDHVLDSLQAAVDGGSAIGAGLAQATADTAHIVGMLSEVEFSATTRPDRKRRIERARHGAGQLCLERFAAAARQEFTARLDALAAIPDDPAMLALEAGARGLRRLEAAGRRLGGGEAYDATLRACLSRLQESSGVLGLGDRVRLVEILMGTEQALLALSQVNGGTGLPP